MCCRLMAINGRGNKCRFDGGGLRYSWYGHGFLLCFLSISSYSCNIVNKFRDLRRRLMLRKRKAVFLLEYEHYGRVSGDVIKKE